jgi:hypothetical protein
VRCVVDAVNNGGANAVSGFGDVITLPTPPVSTSPPAPDFVDVSTNVTQAFLLSEAGSWSGSPDTYVVTWTSDGAGHSVGTCSGNAPSDVTTCGFVVGSGDSSVTMHVVTANRGGGSAEATATHAVPNVPSASVQPAISFGGGTATLTNRGTWSNNPTFFTVQWFVDGSPGIGNATGCTGISVASCTYTPDGTEFGSNFTVAARVTAYNAGGAGAFSDSNTDNIP